VPSPVKSTPRGKHRARRPRSRHVHPGPASTESPFLPASLARPNDNTSYRAKATAVIDRLRPGSPEAHQDSRSFLDLGHANPCWCNMHIVSAARGRKENQTKNSKERGSKLPCGPTFGPSSLPALHPLSDTSTTLSDDWTVISGSPGHHKRRSNRASGLEDSLFESNGGSSSPSLFVVSATGSLAECTSSPWWEEEECRLCGRYACACDSAGASAIE